MNAKLFTTLTLMAGLYFTNHVFADKTAEVTQAHSSHAALKIGYVNLGYILANLPEAQKREAEMQSFAKQLVNEIQDKSKELQGIVETAQQQLDTLTEAQKKQKQIEINKRQLAIEELDHQRGTKMDQKYREVMKPLQDRIQEVIGTIAEEKGYTLIFNKDIDTGWLPTLLFAKAEFNISEVVLEKLKLEVFKSMEKPVLGPKQNSKKEVAKDKKVTHPANIRKANPIPKAKK